MNLVIDRGNTLVKCALFEGNRIRFSYRAERLSDDFIQSLFDLYPIENAILSAVAEINFSEELLKSVNHYIRLNHLIDVPFQNKYKTPETLGRDRIAAVAGAMAEWPDQNLLVIDTGTCLTIDFVDLHGAYLGGNISPGPELRFHGMHDGTANLPLVERPQAFRLIGDSTNAALQGGGFGGCIAEILGWIGLAEERFDKLIVVLSGGDAATFATSIKKKIFVRPDLVLKGLNQILNFHVQKI